MKIYYVDMDEDFTMGIFDSWEKAEDVIKDYCEAHEVAKIELVSTSPSQKAYKILEREWYDEDDDESWDYCYIREYELNKKIIY